MKTAILACKTLRYEIEHAMGITGCRHPAYYIDSGLHNYPALLKDRIQQQLDGMNDFEHIILVFGRCGGALTGIKTGDYLLTMPRVDDCITLLLGSEEDRKLYKDAYFLTQGWLEGERTILDEYHYAADKYGEAVAKELSKSMFGGYAKIVLLDSGSYDIAESLSLTKPFAETFHLKIEVLGQSLDYLIDMICGPWDDGRFTSYRANSVIDKIA